MAMIDIPVGLPAELVPLSWLVGVWEGTGLIEYEVGEETRRHEFGQRVSFSHDGLPYLNYSSFTWLFGADRGTPAEGPTAPLVTETGYWRISRPPTEGDPGPGMLPGVGPRPFTTAASVETLRNASDGFDVEVSVVHPTGVSELYLGRVKGPRVDLATDAVLRTESAKEYSAATRLYGLVEGDLLWAWDIAALGQELRTHSSGRLRPRPMVEVRAQRASRPPLPGTSAFSRDAEAMRPAHRAARCVADEAEDRFRGGGRSSPAHPQRLRASSVSTP